MDNKFSHLDKDGKVNMVDVSAKSETSRKAIASAKVFLPQGLENFTLDQNIETKKGSVIQTAILAGIMGAKKTSDLIPLCHGINLENCQISIQFPDTHTFEIICEATSSGKTGVEMEALTGASIAALTIYDMCKSLSAAMVIGEIKLLEKTGGKKDYFYEKA